MPGLRSLLIRAHGVVMRSVCEKPPLGRPHLSYRRAPIEKLSVHSPWIALFAKGASMTIEKEISSLSNDLFTRLQDMNRAWLVRLRNIRETDAEFGLRLLGAKIPAEAVTICNEWMAARLRTVGTEHRAFTTAWLDLVSDTMRSASASPGKASEHDTKQTS
jgi:hypothetical protein